MRPLLDHCHLTPMFRLADKGHEVVGIEGSEVAAKQFGEDHHLQYNVLPIEGTSIKLYKVGIADHHFCSCFCTI